MSNIHSELRGHVVNRAENKCEYCQLSQEGQEATFHIDHVIPVKAGGETISENLALACVSCSLHKAARQTSIDPSNNQEIPIYNPRKDRWNVHFRWDRFILTGLTPTGRATVELLRMNRDVIVEIRKEESILGRHPLS